ncbi:MAG: efflux RND transporter periplasmic adaptor subunit [Bacteroidota bacterium]|nr:efflux RND transporter periplasmic adaptor subunit [Bacteroidota bacterium]
MKKKTIIAGSTVIVLLGLMTWTLASNKKIIDNRKEVKTSLSDIAVTVATTEMKETDGNLELVGTAQACKEVNVATESAGKIVLVNFKMGDFVAKGKVLAKIDDTYKRLAYENAKLTYNKSKDDLKRYEAMRDGDAVSDTQLRDIRLAYENAVIQLENAKKQWDDTKIAAPFSGYITAQNTELGAYVNTGAAIASMADISQLKVVLDVSESTAYELNQGQGVKITSDVQPEKEYSGRITNIGQKASTSHTYPMEIMIPNNGKDKLKAGTYVNVRVNMSKSGKALMIPRDAIVSSVKDPSVYVVKDNSAKLVRITTGRSFNSNLEVVAGLNEGDKVVTNGQINLTNGSKVSVINKL